MTPRSTAGESSLIGAPRIVEDPHALPPWRYRAQVVDSTFGMVDAAGATPAEAEARVLSRWRRKWLGVEWVGAGTPEAAKGADCGEIAINGCRFALWRRVGLAERVVCFVMLNPSTADASQDDATLRRCRGFARRWGFGWITVGNLWPLRTPSPRALRQWIAEQPRDSLDPLLEQNERFVMAMAQRAELPICAWGAHGARDDRGAMMLATLRKAGIACHALALTRDGHPAHPLRLARSSEPRPIHQRLHELRVPDDQVGVERDNRGVIRRIERSAS